MTIENDTGTDLGLAVSDIAVAGAGANADLLPDMMAFVGSDTLAELVWSPQTGLNIKFAGKKPSFMWDVGPSDFGILRSEDTQDGKQFSESRSVASRHVNAQVVKSFSSADPLSIRVFENGVTGGVDEPGFDNQSSLKVEPITQYAPQEHVESSNTDMDNVKLDKDGSQDATENKKIAEKTSDCRKYNDKLEVESHGSIDSFQSANLSTKRKRSSFEHQMILSHTRIKKKAGESSFVSWISNMLKGLKNHENCDKKMGVSDETPNIKSGKMGFQNVFQSLFIQDEKAHETVPQIENKTVDTLAINEKQISLYEKETKEAPKGMFDTIRSLRLSRADILKWSNSRLFVANLDGFFLRLRVAKCDERAGGSRYSVACITGLQVENQPIRVKVGGIECFVETQNISNCDFLENELVAWWQKTCKNGGTPAVKDLKSKLAERRTMGL